MVVAGVVSDVVVKSFFDGRRPLFSEVPVAPTTPRVPDDAVVPLGALGQRGGLRDRRRAGVGPSGARRRPARGRGRVLAHARRRPLALGRRRRRRDRRRRRAARPASSCPARRGATALGRARPAALNGSRRIILAMYADASPGRRGAAAARFVPSKHGTHIDRPGPRRPGAAAHQDLRLRRQRGARARRRERRHPPRRVHGDHGTVRIRQVHAHAHHGRTGFPDLRSRVDRRHRHHRTLRPRADDPAPPPRRIRVPGVQPGADPRRDRQHPAAVRPRRPPADARSSVPASMAWSRRSGSPTGCATARTSSRAASSSASRSPVRSRPRPTWCSPTSRPATSIRAAAARCWGCSPPPSRDHGQSIAMVTHDPVAASHADRVIFLGDGKDRRRQAAPERRGDLRLHAGVRTRRFPRAAGRRRSARGSASPMACGHDRRDPRRRQRPRA